MSQQRFGLLALLTAALIGGCTDDPVYPTQQIQVTGTDLPVISGDAVFELWLSYPPERTSGKEPVIDHDLPEYFSAGRFLVGADGALLAPGGGPAAFSIPAGYNPALVAEAIVSVEPRDDDDAVPDAMMLWGELRGTPTRGHALLQVATQRTFDTAAIRDRKGSFVLEAPTAATAEDSLSGIWFLMHRFNPSSGDSLTPGLDLPPLPLNHDNDNWIYEAWLSEQTVDGLRYISLGRFRNPAHSDLNAAGPAAGPNTSAAYDFPGEDFVAPRRRLSDSAHGVVVSLQPDDIVLSAPLIRLLELPTMPDTVASREDIHMTPTPKLPLIEVTIDR